MIEYLHGAITIMRVKFKNWLKLSKLQEGLPDPQRILEILKIASDKEFTDETPWWETAAEFRQVLQENVPKTIPIFYAHPERDRKPEPWNYENRDWYMWSHLIASCYGWTLEYIAELDFDDAFALVEEILVDEQLQHEKQWGMSEIAYPYDSGSKKHKFSPLPRPFFMVPAPPANKPTRIPKHMLPVGLVLTGKDNEPPQHN